MFFFFFQEGDTYIGTEDSPSEQDIGRIVKHSSPLVALLEWAFA